MAAEQMSACVDRLCGRYKGRDGNATDSKRGLDGSSIAGNRGKGKDITSAEHGPKGVAVPLLQPGSLTMSAPATCMLPGLSEELVARVFDFATGAWALRLVCRSWADRGVGGFLASAPSLEVSFPLCASRLGLFESAIYYYSAVLQVSSRSHEGAAADCRPPGMTGAAKLEIWREAGEPYGPQSDLISVMESTWTLDLQCLELACGSWSSGPGGFDHGQMISTDWLPQRIPLRMLLTRSWADGSMAH